MAFGVLILILLFRPAGILGSADGREGLSRARALHAPVPQTARSSLSALVVLLGLNQLFEHGFGDFQINPYYARIINLIGINITLAVSLNLINGLAGQFSIGHAGFMAVGGYTATYVTVYHGAGDRGAARQHARRTPPARRR